MNLIIKKLISELVEEFDNKETRENIEYSVIEPCLNFIIKKLQPYFIATTITIIVLFVCISFIIYLLLSPSSSSSSSFTSREV
jgi:hypothetical protein